MDRNTTLTMSRKRTWALTAVSAGLFVILSLAFAENLFAFPFPLSIVLVIAWAVAGYWGLDWWLLPALGIRWERAIHQVDVIAERTAQETNARGRRTEPRPGAP